ncbi:uncharacterized protein LOC132745383 [Ruditapes philippinarum]|uniref:uncharacterized protein LOC132745383 n=1 Tax=Ruditapes philippinarum TaxID=129788 RepID=UPI00295AB652|nr:uncharacterized protein LOC132745383 [Ruditapes philippinarum]
MVTHFETYLNVLGNDGDFYRRPLPSTQSGTIRYGYQPVGINILNKFMKEIAEKGSLQGSFTNHSGKRTCATTMYTAGIDEQEIMDRTGHRSVTAVRKYKQSSDQVRKMVSNVLDLNKEDTDLHVSKVLKYEKNESSCKTTSDKSETTVSNNIEKRRDALADLTNQSGKVNFTGCTFNF